jgi:nitrogen fixation/metabolism regulation signal transduction histidine kinase
MEKVLLLSTQRNADQRRGKSTVRVAEQASRLTHAIMNQLTIIYLSCAKLRRRFEVDLALQSDSDIQIIECAVEQIASQTEALRFRLEKTTRSTTKQRSQKLQKQITSTTQLSFISPRQER